MRRCVLFGILMSLLGLSSCGLYIQQQELARQRAIEAEIQSAMNDMSAEAGRGRYPNYAAAFKDLQSRVQTIYSRHGLQLDPFDQAFLSYSVALAGRVDRGEISVDDAKYLMDKMHADMQLERQRLALQYQAVQAQRDLVWQQWWSNYWSNWQRTYQRTYRNPVSCTVRSYGGGTSYIDCY